MLEQEIPGGVLRPEIQEEVGENEDEEWVLPPGAEYIVRQIAAEHILAAELGDIYGMAMVGQLPKQVTRKAEFETIRRIVDEFPGTCQREYFYRWEDCTVRRLYPLAALCCLRPNLETVKSVYGAYPDAIQSAEDSRRSLPLHYACGFGASFEVVHFLFTAYPKAITSCRTDMVSPLHLACAYYNGEPDVINFLLNQWPQGASQTATDMGWLPLHSSAHGGVPPSILERLVEAYPQSITTLDSKGRSPLHIACERKGNLQTVKFLLSKAPQMASREDESRFTPVSLAAMHQSVEVLQVLLNHNEMLEDQHGVTLLHMAAFQNDVEVIDFLAKEYPYMVTARVRDGDMYTPLLAACRHSASVDVVRALIQHDRSTLNMPDGEGRPPIESARQAGADPAVIQVLQEEMNASAAAAFCSSWPPPFMTLETAPFRQRSRMSANLMSMSSLESLASFSVEPSLNASSSASTVFVSNFSISSTSVSTVPSEVARCLPLRWLRFWRR